jgi:hypothetical protein
MPFTIPTLAELTDFVVAVGRALLPERDWSRRKSAYKWFSIVTHAVTDVHAHLTSAVDDLLPDRASGDYLKRWGTIRGVLQKDATPARGTDALRVYGLAGASVDVGDTLTHAASGLRFQVNEAATIGVGDTSVDVDVIAIDTGSQTRLSAGEKLYFDSPPTNIEEEAELVLDLDQDGDDQESEPRYRDRILDKFRRPPLGGAAADYEQWSLELTGIDSAYCYPERQGRGSVDVAALHGGRGSARLLSSGERAELLAYLTTKKPIGVTLRVLEVQATTVDTETTVRTDGEPEHEFDWDDSTPPEVAAWNSSTLQLDFVDDRPASMAAGDRLIIKTATASCEEVVIESLVSTDGVILESAPDVAPVAGNLVYSGGPLVEPIRQRQLEHFDELGPTNTDAAPYGAWEANVRPSRLESLARDEEGCKDATGVAPASITEMADNGYPDDGIVFLAIPRQVLVRKEW